MFDLRYHVASLAAVFVALLIGILVGVGLTGKVDDAEKDQLRRILQSQEDELRTARQRDANRSRADEALGTIVQHGVPRLMEDRLLGKRIGLLFVGNPDPDVRDSVAAALEDAGANDVTRLRAIKVPIDADVVAGKLRSRPGFAQLTRAEQLRELGRVLAREFVTGGDAPTWDALATELVVGQRGRSRPPLDGVVVYRNVGAQEGPTAVFLGGLYRGLRDAGAPAIGVEPTDEEVSAVPVFDAANLSTVDNVETPAGRVALALLLAGAQAGNYGVKETAERPIPEESLERE